MFAKREVVLGLTGKGIEEDILKGKQSESTKCLCQEVPQWPSYLLLWWGNHK